jgi:imidazole glycerol-phosphate synthase subunit HisF
MLKIRIIPTLLHKDVGLVKGKQFDSWRRTGSAMQQIKVYNLRGVDELVFSDISASKQGRGPNFEMIDNLADECFMPLTVGGGISNIDQARQMLKVGADKLSINTGAIERPSLISEIADKFGVQCVVVAIDYKIHEDGSLEVYSHSGSKATGINPIEFAIKAAKYGAGEILLTSIDRDGTYAGYDIETISKVSNSISIPIIASGGAGSYKHMLDAVKLGNASAIAAASIYHFTDLTPLLAKKYLNENDIPVRL